MLTRRTLVASLLWTGLAAADSDWKDSDTIQPKDLAKRLAGSSGKPMILQVGFANGYNQKHILGALYAGPGNKPEGLEKLKKAVANTPKDAEIVLYCGCCPWDHCPNMKPSFTALRAAGFKNVKAVVIENNFGKDWIEQGFPVQDGSPAS
jgi:thiosulfate/3-mercaptopyruvate sulfurtransferase